MVGNLATPVRLDNRYIWSGKQVLATAGNALGKSRRVLADPKFIGGMRLASSSKDLHGL